MEPVDELRDLYWRDNMVNTVLFADAIKSAADEKLSLAIEVGPHPALRAQRNRIFRMFDYHFRTLVS